MEDVGIWLLLEQQSTMTDATMVIGAYRSYEAAEAVLEAKQKAAGWTGESDDDEDREPWWEIETIMLRGEPEPLPAEIPAPKNRFYCPDCKGTEVHVTAQYEVRIVESGDEVETRPMDGHWDWDETSKAWCGKCDFEGTVDDFDHDLEHRYDQEKAKDEVKQ